MFTDPISLCQLGNELYLQGRHAEAVAAYDSAIAEIPDYCAALNNRGVVLLALGEATKALASFETALAFEPDFTEATYNKANTLRDLRRFAEALAAYDAVIAERPNYAEAYNNRGNALQELQRPLDALVSYDKALALKRSYPAALENKAILLGEFGFVDSARHLLEAVIRATPLSARAHYHLVRIKRMTRLDPQLATLEALAQDRTRLSSKDAIAIAFALGKAYDDIGNFERAFARFAEGNALQRAGIAYDEAQTLSRMGKIAEAFSPGALSAHRSLAHVAAAPIFIFGMPRSGSSLIEQILSRHPEISACGEIDAFEQAAGAQGFQLPEMLSRLSPVQLLDIGERYLQNVGTEPGKRSTDKKPSNFLFAGLIHLALPNARLIHTRRNPVDTCWSCFSQRFSQEGGLPSAYDLSELGRYYRAYEALMQHWQRVLPEGAMLTVDYEDVVADLEGQTRRILDFCGLPWNADCLDFHNSHRQVRTASSGQVNQPLYKSAVGRGKNYEPFLGPLMKELDVFSHAA